MPKQNPLLAKQAAALEQARRAGYAQGARTTVSMFELIVPIALNDTIGLGAERLGRVNQAINELFQHYTDSVDSSDREYAMEELRRRCAQITGWKKEDV